MTLEINNHVTVVLGHVGGRGLNREHRLGQDGRVQVEELLPGPGLGRRLFVGLVPDRNFSILGLDRRERAELEAGQVAPRVVPTGGANVLPVVLIGPVGREFRSLNRRLDPGKPARVGPHITKMSALLNFRNSIPLRSKPRSLVST